MSEHDYYAEALDVQEDIDAIMLLLRERDSCDAALIAERAEVELLWSQLKTQVALNDKVIGTGLELVADRDKYKAMAEEAGLI